MTTPPYYGQHIELEERLEIENVGGTAHQDINSAVMEAADRGNVQALGDILRTNKEAVNAVHKDTGDKERFHFILFSKKV